MKSKNKLKKILALCLGLAMAFGQGKTLVLAKAGNWGLGFPNEGQKPVGNEEAAYLKQYDAYFVGEGEEKVIYLTFDAGYENGYTETILDVLRENEVPATFFLVSNYLRDQPEIVRRMAAEGHIVGNHTMKHPDMSAITDKETFAAQLTGIEDIYRDVTGQEINKFYRPPEGKYSEDNLKWAQELGYKTIFWSLAYRDFDNNNQPTKEEAFSKLIPRIHPGAILLLHNTSKANAELLDDLIKEYKAMGYAFKSLNYLAAEPFNTNSLLLP